MMVSVVRVVGLQDYNHPARRVVDQAEVVVSSLEEVQVEGLKVVLE